METYLNTSLDGVPKIEVYVNGPDYPCDLYSSLAEVVKERVILRLKLNQVSLPAATYQFFCVYTGSERDNFDSAKQWLLNTVDDFYSKLVERRKELVEAIFKKHS